MLTFNQRGLLSPHVVINSTLEELENEFVTKLNEEKRRFLFERYKEYVKELKSICEVKTLKQWINGSFVTKAKNPSDIDIVTFIDYEIVKQKEPHLKQFVFPKSIDVYDIDAYFITVHSKKDLFERNTLADRAYWLDHFGKTKPSRQRKGQAKGFLEIIV